MCLFTFRDDAMMPQAVQIPIADESGEEKDMREAKKIR